MTDRALFQCQTKNEYGWDAGELSVVVTPTHIRFAVEEEMAVDSYNQTFQCTANLSKAQARELVDLLTRALAS